jgi:hypothetical protein
MTPARGGLGHKRPPPYLPLERGGKFDSGGVIGMTQELPVSGDRFGKDRLANTIRWAGAKETPTLPPPENRGGK